MAPESTPLLEIDDALFRRAPGPLESGASPDPAGLITGDVRTVALVGGWHPLFAALSGTLELPPRSISIRGQPGRMQVIAGQLGVMVRDFKWPDLKVRELLETSSALSGHSPAKGRDHAARALSELAIEPLAHRPLSGLRAVELRTVELAHAVLGDPEVVVIEDPFWGLGGPDVEIIATALQRITEARHGIFAVPHARTGTAEQGLAAGASEIYELWKGSVVLASSSDLLTRAGDTYLLEVDRPLPGLAEELGPLGYLVQEPLTSHTPAQVRGRVCVRLPPGTSTRPLLAAVRARGATLLELRAMDSLPGH